MVNSTMINMIRAPLFVPATRPERFAKAANSGADAIILDLEDAVAPADKIQARNMLTRDFTNLPVIVRSNPVGSTWYETDILAIKAMEAAAVMLPKSEDLTEISRLVAMLDGLPVIALIETAQGLANARTIADLKGVERIAFGSVDFCADVGCSHLREILLPARSELVFASRLAGISAPIDGVTVQLNDPALVHEDAKHARAVGMTGKLCIHPKQIDDVLTAFLPTETEISWAQRVLATGEGAASLDGEMVDEPVRIRARAILVSTTRMQ